MADSFEILVDSASGRAADGYRRAAKDIGLSLMAAALTPVCPDTLLN